MPEPGVVLVRVEAAVVQAQEEQSPKGSPEEYPDAEVVVRVVGRC